ncbi:hypothetical protein P168DRAFT_291478 [Aspergillus campestris IBT 28561]|uniref:Transglutaminase-like domain-containing protein n=1 Tax=Aspergillus campestris (strain IBT 28561) TaxID=1392248 RepID=A0A2I1D0F6_ASPC2|nr:uncharacterized protein P168DRAFT_291478 [Aspergillus campestris IBT 28561]PKY03352.1 hypothetical protein P168DRAFT_291478 [Aspergillus campestris IBT 28561]
MAEETQVMSIQQRIAALKHAQTGHGPESAPSPGIGKQVTLPARPAAPPPYSAINYSPVNGDTRPPPTPGSTGQRPKVPPPLPSRKNSNQPAPALPPRRPSQDPSRRNSVESTASDLSRSTTTSASRASSIATSATSVDSGRLRAPPLEEANLPPLPPKRQSSQPPSRPMSSRTSSDSQPRLPPRRPSSNSLRTNGSSLATAETRPPLPSRNSQSRSSLTNGDVSTQPATRKLPPPPTDIVLGNARESGFGRMNRAPTDPSGTPPPVPLASRPDLSKLQATKPRPQASGTSSATPAASCMLCRDFSAPDEHAARYPRQSLPTHDLGWLARELTEPFPSHTDKARALFTWCHHNVEYDVHSYFNKCIQRSTPESTARTGLAVCQGYAELYATLANSVGMEAVVISGHGKGFGYNAPAPGAPIPTPNLGGHAWNAVRIDHGQWKLLDACWGAGNVKGKGLPYQKAFKPAMFTMSNDEFGLRHFPKDPARFYRDDGRPTITWEEYILSNPDALGPIRPPQTFLGLEEFDIDPRSFRPGGPTISISQPGPLRFQFGFRCEHWTLERHCRQQQPGCFLLWTHGVDGRQVQRLPFTHVRGSMPGGGGDYWYVDVPNARMLGAAGQELNLAVVKTMGDRHDCRGVTPEEYRRAEGRVGMSWSYLAQWDLVA